MLAIEDIKKMQSAINKDSFYKVVAHRAYNNNKLKRQGADIIQGANIIKCIIDLDDKCDRACGFGSGDITLLQKDNKIILTFVYSPVITFYKTLKQVLTIEEV